MASSILPRRPRRSTGSDRSQPARPGGSCRPWLPYPKLVGTPAPRREELAAGQERGEIASDRRSQTVPDGNGVPVAHAELLLPGHKRHVAASAYQRRALPHAAIRAGDAVILQV